MGQLFVNLGVRFWYSKWLWVILFVVWGAFFSGALTKWVGSPGLVQAIRLKSLLNDKRDQLEKLESEIFRIQAEIAQLEKSRFEQEREIRKTLGYAAKDELIFEFSAPVRQANLPKSQGQP